MATTDDQQPEQLASPSLSSPSPPPTQQQPFGTLAYERVLSESECRKLERVQRRLAAALDDGVHVWVRDARPFAHGKESQLEAIQLRLHPSLPVAEVRDRIQEKYEQISSYRERTDGHLQLFLNGKILEGGKLLAEYLDTATRSSHNDTRPQKKWPVPFAGILWIVPFRPTMKIASDAWTGSGSA